MAHPIRVCHLCFVWCPNKSVIEASEPGAAFLAARWHELYDEYTPDTFHPKLYGLPSLAAEATMIGQLYEDHDAWLKHLKHVQAELSETLTGGVETAECSPRHLTMLDQMAKAQSPKQAVQLGRVLDLEGFASILEEKVRAQFKDFEVKSRAREKERADRLLTALATFAFRKGCSNDDTGNVDHVFQKGAEGIQNWILDCLPTARQEFDCIVALAAGSTEDETAIRKVTDTLGVIRVGHRFPGLPDEPGWMFFRHRVTALRAYDAIETLKTELRASLNLLVLYKQTSASVIREQGWVVGKSGAESVAMRTPSFCNLHPRKNYDELANKAVKALGGGRNEPAIRAALDLHNLALATSDHRLRLVNLWSALECLASLAEGETIISRVERLICPILAWRKPEKVVRYLTISIRFWLQHNPEIDRGTLPFGLGDNGTVAADRILTLLTEKRNSPGIVSLLNAVSGHPLLLYRINKAWELFNDPKALHANLVTSSKRMNWHLWRIYRARNLLVHQGVEPECLPQLANHLQQYLSWTLSRILHGLAFKAESTSRDSLHLWQSKSEHLLASLKNRPEVLVLGDVFPEELRDPQLPVYPAVTDPGSP